MIQKRVEISVVAPCFNEEECLPEFHRRTVMACEAAVVQNYEIILVDDGSSDGTWGVMSALAASHRHTTAVRLFRNHGHQLASTAGLSVAGGDHVLLIDADLQDPPELLSEMLALIRQGADVVYGQRTARHGETWFKRSTAAAFYRLLGRLGSVSIPPNTGDFRLMSARVVDLLLAMPERQRFIRGMVSWIGGTQVPILYERRPREQGTSKYPLLRMIRLAAVGITSFSTAPLHLATWLGAIVAIFAVVLLGHTIFEWFRGSAITGWSSIMTAISFFAGVQLLILGIIGEYIAQLFHESKGRPLFMIDRITNAGVDLVPPADFSRRTSSERRAFVEGGKAVAIRGNGGGTVKPRRRSSRRIVSQEIIPGAAE